MHLLETLKENVKTMQNGERVNGAEVLPLGRVLRIKKNLEDPDILLIDFKIDIIRAIHSQSLYLGTVIVFIGGYIKLYYSVF